MIKITVWCTFQVVGFHYWENAPVEVSYLRMPHRHVFHFKVGAQVTESDREIEFHHLRAAALEELCELFSPAMGYVEQAVIAFDFGGSACEHIANKLGQALLISSKYVPQFVEVSEDGENGAVVEFVAG